MGNVALNNIQGALQVFAFKSIPAFASDLPPNNLFTENFDESVEKVGISVTTRVPTTIFGTLNDLTNGWESQNVSSSAITAVLAMKGHDHVINATQWDTIGEQQLLKTFGDILGKQVANGLTVAIYNNVTTSYFTNTASVNTQAAFVYAAPTSSLTAISAELDNLEIPQADRYCVMTPTMFQAMKASNNIFQALIYGNPQIIQQGGYSSTDNSARPELNVDGLNIFKSPRLYGATKPYGGDSYSSADKLVGFAGNRAGLVVAARAPSSFNVPGVYSYVGTEPTSGWPFLFMAALDVSKPAWRFGIYTLFGTAAGNPNAIIPILTVA